MVAPASMLLEPSRVKYGKPANIQINFPRLASLYFDQLLTCIKFILDKEDIITANITPRVDKDKKIIWAITVYTKKNSVRYEMYSASKGMIISQNGTDKSW